MINGAGLSASIYNDMINPQVTIREHYDRGLGWSVVKDLPDGEYALEHGGSDRGVRTIAILLPESKRGIVVLTNGDNGIFVYNGTGIYYEDTGLIEGVTYYYQAWSYTEWIYDSTTLNQWSDDNASEINTTNNAPTIDLIDPSPNGTTGVSLQPVCQVWANDTEGDTLDVFWYENTIR